MKPFLFILFWTAAWINLHAQTILLKNGNVVSADGLTRNGDLIMVTVKTASGGKGQVGFNISDIQELRLPAPGALATASADIAKGDAKGALALLTPVVEEQKTLRDLPGNWWAQAAVIEVQALSGLGRDAETGALVSEIASFSKSPEILTSARLQMALTANDPDPKHALATIDGIISHCAEPQTLSQAWIKEGEICAGEHEFDEALMNYLSVTVFFPEHNPLVPKALWGAGQAYDKLKDKTNALKTYQTLASHYSDSPEARLAEAEIQKKASQQP